MSESVQNEKDQSTQDVMLLNDGKRWLWGKEARNCEAVDWFAGFIGGDGDRTGGNVSWWFFPGRDELCAVHGVSERDGVVGISGDLEYDVDTV